jgi:lipopolysaccharide/colanic/teichoic acid biosynthesis glycosyltransferase
MIAKRPFDIVFSLAAIVVSLPLVAISCFLVWAGDGQWPLYSGRRVGRHGREFSMFKLRTMVVGAEELGGSSTAASDRRLIPLGAALRRFKLDELPQFFNVLRGEMSVVGPRPNVRKGGVDRYTSEEKRLLSVRPGVTDLASIVFADEGEILRGSPDPDALYDSVIRPWKSRLALEYVDRRSLALDLRLIALTIVGLFSRRAALRGAERILVSWKVEPALQRICSRSEALPPGAPPGVAA